MHRNVVFTLFPSIFPPQREGGSNRVNAVDDACYGSRAPNNIVGGSSLEVLHTLSTNGLLENAYTLKPTTNKCHGLGTKL